MKNNYTNQTKTFIGADKGTLLSTTDPLLLEIINKEYKLTGTLDFDVLYNILSIKYPEYFI